MRTIDRSAQRRHGLDGSTFNSSMSFGEFFLECPCRIAVPIDRAERLVGFRCLRLHHHQVISVVAFDDAAGGISDCVQRVYRDNMSGKRHFFEKRPDGSSLAILVMKTVTGNGQPRVMRNQSCGFEMAVPVALRFAPRRRLPSAASAVPMLSRGADQRFCTVSIAAGSATSRTRYMTDLDGGSYCSVFGLNYTPSASSSVWFSA